MSETATPDAAGPGPKPGSIAFYAQMYGKDERTVKRWKAEGVEKGDPTPLENPELMRAWWARCKAQRIPPGIDAAVTRWRIDHSAPAPVLELPVQVAAPPMAAEKAAARKAIMDEPVDEDAIGPEHTLRRLLELEPKLHRIATDPGQAKEYSAIVARIGPAAKALREENERLRKLIPRTEAETMIHEFHAPVERETRQLYGAMCEILGLPATPHSRDAWNKECDKLFARFQEEVFR